jgi:hypothetical protein
MPTKSFNDITQLGLKALNLATAHAAALADRLPQGTAKNLADDLELLGAVVPGAKQARAESISATSSQKAALEKGYARVKQVRAAIRKSKASMDVRHAYGVGAPTNGRLVRDVKAAISQIVDHAKANPDEAAALGILKKDIDALDLALTTITTADTKQEEARANAPLTTRERNRTAHRILDAVSRIEGAGRLEFADDPATRAHFEALGATPKKKTKPAPAQPLDA